MHEISRRTFMGGSAAALFLLTGCSPQQAASSKSFPVSINHHFGTTTIPSKPKRVIAVGLASADLCVALGVVPVMIPTSEIHEFRTTPWFDKGLAKLNAALPETYQDIELPIRKFAQYKPDLILAVNSSITGDQYRQLSELAPVVAYADVPGNTDWRTSTLMAATALGTDKGEEVIAGTENSISKAAIPFADFSALTAMFFVARGIAGAAFELYGADTNPQRILGDYGVQRSPTLGELEEGGALTSTDRYVLSPREAPNVVSDAYIASVRSTELAALEESNALGVFPGFDNGQGIILDYATDAYALTEASPLSVAFAAGNVVSEFARVNFVLNGAGATTGN